MLSQKIKNYIFFGIYLILNPGLFKLIFKGVYIPVYIQYEWLKNYKINTFIDVGAYKGRVLRTIIYLFPNARIYAFEPLIEYYNLIRQQSLSSNITLEKLALSNKVGNSSFYKNSYPPASSILPVKKELGKFQFIAKTKKIIVKTDTLDNYFKDIKLFKDIVLKLDTQGSEYFILKAGKKFLKKVSILIVETAFDGLYKREKNFHQVYKLLVDCGFEYRGNIPDSEFYPHFNPSNYYNSIFTKRARIY